MTVIQPRPTHIPYQCAKFGDDRELFNVIFDVCYVKYVKGLKTHISIFLASKLCPMLQNSDIYDI